MKKPTVDSSYANVTYLAIKHSKVYGDVVIHYDDADEAIKQCRTWIASYPKEYVFTEKPYGNHLFYASSGEEHSVRVDVVYS